MKLMVLSCVHGAAGHRKVIYNHFCTRMEAIRKKYGIEMLVVGSEGEVSEEITKKYGHHYLEFTNRPVSNKWNAGMGEIRKHNPTHVMILGSDDFVSDNLIEGYLEVLATERFDIIGITDSYYFGLNDKRSKFGVCGYWGGYPKKSIIGYARVFNKEILDGLGWKPWIDRKNSGLDFSVNQRLKQCQLRPRSHRMSIKENGWLHVDIKTRGNISSMYPLTLEEVDYKELLLKHLPLKEANSIIDYADRYITKHKRV
ncbi:MAG: hypothetical protein WC961_07410 [Anaerovoracaceae bacterium]